VNENSPIDYLVVGHVCNDITPVGVVAGGTAVYASQTAQVMGCRTAVVTSAAPEYAMEAALGSITVHHIPSEQTTTFENSYTSTGRRQRIHAVSGILQAKDIPVNWQRASIVHLGPVANEIDPSLINLFSNSLVGVTPQGWFRHWNSSGQVFLDAWPAAADVLPLAGAVIISPEDLPNPELLHHIRDLSPLVVLTQDADGCTVFCRDEVRHIPAPVVEEVNPTGAGDIFAALFLIRLHQTKGNPWEAAAFASRVAAQTVTKEKLGDKLLTIKESYRRDIRNDGFINS